MFCFGLNDPSLYHHHLKMLIELRQRVSHDARNPKLSVAACIALLSRHVALAAALTVCSWILCRSSLLGVTARYRGIVILVAK